MSEGGTQGHSSRRLGKATVWRLGIDLGTNSLGWCALRLQDGRPSEIMAIGSRIFADGRDEKSGASLAVERRAARAMRRRRDRFKQRQAALLKHLKHAGLFPRDETAAKALEIQDPYGLRPRALSEPLAPLEIGRAIFHLNQRRGFQSNRKAERKADEDPGKIAQGIANLEAAIADAGARTLGEFLHLRRACVPDANQRPHVRARVTAGTDGYDFYPSRRLLAEEFDAIWEAQAAHHPDILTDEVHDRLYEIVFHQRPLKGPEIGFCTLVPGERRLPKAHPLFQRRRLLEEVNALMIVAPGERPVRLTREQRDLLVLKLKDKRKVTFASLRKVLKLDPSARFNKESENRTELAGDEVAAEMGAATRFGKGWQHLDAEQQWAVVERLIEEEDAAALVAWLMETHGLTEDQARATAAARLPAGYGRFGPTATGKLVAALQSDVLVYSEAVERAGLGHHSDFRTGEVHERLPYYGSILERHVMPGTGNPKDREEDRIGRLSNPTVHIGLNQLRRVINRLIDVYGRPAEIAVELARDLKLTDDDKKALARRNNRNRLEAERRSQLLIEQFGVADTGANRALVKLWEELSPDAIDRRCIYSNRQISARMLFSGEVEVDHILPFSSTLDDGNGNKLLCLREANRIKRKRSPWEARADFADRFGQDASWEAIAARAARLPREKRWRFEPDAMERFTEDDGFLARQLVDTQYLSRLAGEYLRALYPEKGEGSSHVWVSPGRMTELVRRKLGLNDLLPDHNYAGGADQPKNRKDHRHHAIDAFVIGIIDRSLLQRIARASAEEGESGRDRVIVPDPWDDFRPALRNALSGMVVSHRPDHGSAGKRERTRDQTAGRLHNDTAYGLTGIVDAKGNTIVVHRIPFASLKAEDLEPGGKRWIADEDLRRALTGFMPDRPFEERLRAFPQLGPLHFRRIRRVRMQEPLQVIPIRDKEGRPYKGYKGDSNYRYDVWELPGGDWKAEVVSMFQAHQPGWTSGIRAACPTARKVLSLHQDDLVAIEEDESGPQWMRVVKFGQNGQVTLVPPQEGGSLKARDALPNDVDPFKYRAPTAGGLKRLKARQVRVDELGRVSDPGFPARTARRKTRKKSSGA